MTFDSTHFNRLTTAIRDVDEAARAFSNAGIDVRIERMRDQLDFSFHFQLFPLGAAELICTNWSTDNWSRAEFTDRMAVMIDPKGTAPSCPCSISCISIRLPRAGTTGNITRNPADLACVRCEDRSPHSRKPKPLRPHRGLP